jgi:hypothetical protein
MLHRLRLLPLCLVLLAPLACDSGDDDDTCAIDDDTDVQPDDDTTGEQPDDDDSAPPPPAPPVAGVVASPHPEVATLLQVTWTQTDDVPRQWLEYSFEDDEWLATPEAARATRPHSEILLGLPAETEVSFRFASELDGEVVTSPAPYTATTGALPDGLPQPSMLSWDTVTASPERWMLTSIELQDKDWYQGPWYLVVLDRKGRIVWYRIAPDERATMHARLASDGSHFLWEATSIYQGDKGGSSTLHRTTMDLTYDVTIDLPGLGSTFAETDDGTVLFDDYTDWPPFTWLEELLADGSRRRVWECMEWGHPLGLNMWGCDPNETIWVRETDTVLWSMWGSDTVVEIDRPTGEVVRQFGRMPGSWDFDPVEAGFEMQHYPYFTDAGTLLVSTHTLDDSDEREQRAREYALDDKTETLTEIWSYGEGVEHYATYAGEAIRLANGNTLISYGTGADLREVTHDGEIVWEVQWDETYLIGHVSLIGDLYEVNRGPEG